MEVSKINQDKPLKEVYEDLAAEWYLSPEGPMALTRVETKAQMPWILAEIRKYIGYKAEILDVGSGAGFFSNEAARAGHKVTGLDISTVSLKVAELMDKTQTVRYVEGDAYKMPFPKESFDVVVAMDLFEHVSDPEKIMMEMSRVLRPGGLLFFHTINKNALSYLIVIKGMRWFLKNTPPEYHTYSLLRTPEQINDWCDECGLIMQQVRGLRPKILQRGFWRLLWNHDIADNMGFVWSRSKMISFSGYAKKFREH
ncbi:MAG: 3-demethylubiquinone-9 3-O-methyltransferase [Bdellovibrio sp.]|nr:3-demethylubiquinone-9 3-O-methyltransferase [Bdellovibrio sp.]